MESSRSSIIIINSSDITYALSDANLRNPEHLCSKLGDQRLTKNYFCSNTASLVSGTILEEDEVEPAFEVDIVLTKSFGR